MELETPPRTGRVLLMVWGLHAVLVTSVVLAARNLLDLHETVEGCGVLPALMSAVWLVLVLGACGSSIRTSGGLRAWLTDWMGELAPRGFVRIDGEEAPVLRFGHLAPGIRFLANGAIPVSAITAVTWSAGQATAMAGRDMDDWIVCIRHGAGRIRCVEPSARRDVTESFGNRLVELLKAAGAKSAVETGPR